jgi:Fe-Mn family superoxide dismutase
LEEIVKTQKGKTFNNAAQIWNHTFYWNCMAPNAGGNPTGKLAEAIDKTFGSFDEFKKKFNEEAANHFGSGWCWLVKDSSNNLKIISLHDAGNPLTENLTPILTCDVWEHAYYIDYRNDRGKYLQSWWNLVNWKFAEEQFTK